MYKNYLEDLSLSVKEKDQIAKLGASSAAALLAMIQSAPQDFERYLGTQRCLEIVIALQKLIGDSERAVLDVPVKEFYSTGAVINRKAPKIQPPKYNIAHRDFLFKKIQELREQHDSSPAMRLTINQLEQELDKILQQ